MDDRRLDKLLASAGDDALEGADGSVAKGPLGPRIRATYRRRRRKRQAVAGSFAAVIVCGLAAWLALPRGPLPPGPVEQLTDSSAEPTAVDTPDEISETDADPMVELAPEAALAALERRIEALRQMADDYQRLIDGAERAALESRLRAARQSADAARRREIREQLAAEDRIWRIVDRTARRILDRADRLHAEQGDVAAAVAEYRRLLELFPDTLPAETARDRLATIQAEPKTSQSRDMS